MLKVKLFDEEHEEDLEEAVNAFLETITEPQLKEIQYQVAISDSLKDDEDETIYSYSAMIIYRE
ncbi:sporulation protein Cse60 [Fictibacillus sp. Mic-4]|uniref:sporulation protein Cse60 n=1 Tax=Fictibacillus TaxID=1329200 RepID=UPI00041C7A46|nr:sporulation protein Cse60 [Fictibacillus gelatini]